MNWRRIPLWLIGLVVWVALSWLFVSVLPAERGPYSERPFAKAVLFGGVIGIAVMGVDLARRPRRIWLWGLMVWGLIVCWSAWSGAFGDDSDIDQIVGSGIALGGLVGAPFIVASFVAWSWRSAGRFIAERPRLWRASVHGNALEISRKTETAQEPFPRSAGSGPSKRSLFWLGVFRVVGIWLAVSVTGFIVALALEIIPDKEERAATAALDQINVSGAFEFRDRYSLGSAGHDFHDSYLGPAEQLAPDIIEVPPDWELVDSSVETTPGFERNFRVWEAEVEGLRCQIYFKELLDPIDQEVFADLRRDHLKAVAKGDLAVIELSSLCG